jgi:hypothetical protein
LNYISQTGIDTTLPLFHFVRFGVTLQIIQEAKPKVGGQFASASPPANIRAIKPKTNNLPFFMKSLHKLLRPLLRLRTAGGTRLRAISAYSGFYWGSRTAAFSQPTPHNAVLPTRM